MPILRGVPPCACAGSVNPFAMRDGPNGAGGENATGPGSESAGDDDNDWEWEVWVTLTGAVPGLGPNQLAAADHDNRSANQPGRAQSKCRAQGGALKGRGGVTVWQVGGGGVRCERVWVHGCAVRPPHQ
jgi:hypothetical protein